MTRASEPLVVLAVLPFFPVHVPSLALALLRSGLERAGLQAQILYLNLEFAQQLGLSDYEWISDGRPARADLLGEWIFSGALFGRDESRSRAYARDVLDGGSVHHRAGREAVPADWRRVVAGAEAAADAFIRRCAERILALHPAMVGLSSTFQSHVACLAVARRIKELSPATYVVVGGSNCDGIMGRETLEQFPFLDSVVSGEGDEVFPRLAQRRFGRAPAEALPGVHTREGGAVVFAASPAYLADLDSTPLPDYDDYYAQLAASGLSPGEGGGVAQYVVAELSRGCWWGERTQCLFCGLNGAHTGYRSKSSDRALAELLHLADKYPRRPIALSDNILDRGYQRTLLPALAASRRQLRLFSETKANLRRDQVRALRDAGFDRVQPGIESLSTPVLRLMRKGTTAIQNIQALKACQEYGVTPVWGLLWGIPGEDPEDYAGMAALLPSLAHLTPPDGAGPIRLDRFSPLFDQAAEYGLTEVEPLPAYRHVYPLEAASVRNLAYFFTYRHADGRRVDEYTRCVADAVASWRSCHPTSMLFVTGSGENPVVVDTRPCAGAPMTALRALEGDVLRHSAEIVTTDQLRRAIESQRSTEVDPAELDAAIAALSKARYLFSEGPQHLGLPLTLGPYYPGPGHTGALLALLRERGGA